MGGPRSKVNLEEVLAAFHTEEPFKAYASRIGMSPNTLRKRWKAEFGEEAFKERGKRLQAKAASKTAKATAGNRAYKDVEVPCSKCGSSQIFKSNQAAQMDLGSFICDRCKFDRECPVCHQRVDGARGLSGHFRHQREAGDEAHIRYGNEEVEQHWADKTEGKDYVRCLECGYRAESLARHLKAVHGITADQYRDKHGEVLIRAVRLTEKRQEAARNRVGGCGKGQTKQVQCPSCGAFWEGSQFLVDGTHDFRCKKCQQEAEDAKWEWLSEPADYVTCLECGYRAESLVSHLQHEHPGYRAKHPGAFVVALGSLIRDKTALRGVPRGSGFGEKIRQAKLLNFTLEDFEPYLESDGSVDHRRAMEGLECAWPTLKRYLEALELTATTKYLEQAQAERRVTLTVEQLEPFKLGNGKVSIAKAMSDLGYCNHTIKKECRKLGLEWAHGNVSQRKCLDAVAEVLGGLDFQEEWKSWRFTNPKTGHRFRFDGYFPDVGLVVEFMGNFHYKFPNHFMVHESYRPEWEKLVERDGIKRKMIEAAPDLIYFEVREDEPYSDVSYLKGRLVEMGVV